ncbi:MAG TPA: methyltransferase domain-containing protein [Acidimicrobiia bacterium]
MTAAETTTPTIDTSADAFAERVFAAVLGAQDVHAIYLGDRLGWYRALAEHGPLTSVELAERTASNERYAREWLEHQAVGGYVTVDDVDAAATERRYTLPEGHAEVLTDEDSLTFLAPLARFIGGVGFHLDKIAAAYRDGGGVSWAELGEDPREAQAAVNRPLFLHQLGQEILPAIPDVHDRLRSGGRAADVGCGAAWSAIGIARSYPEVTVDGFDIDEPSIEMGRRNAVEYGVADRVQLHVSDGAAAEPAGGYNAVFAFECIHDMPDPVSVLASMRRLAGDDGAVVVMDERTEDRFTAPGTDVERLFYGYSLTCCLPDCLSSEPSEGTGTVMRTDTLADYARRAGFDGVEVLPIEHETFRFYRLHH